MLDLARGFEETGAVAELFETWTRARVDNRGALTRLTEPLVWAQLLNVLPLRDVLSLCLSWRVFARALRDYVDCDVALVDACRLLWLQWWCRR